VAAYLSAVVVAVVFALSLGVLDVSHLPSESSGGSLLVGSLLVVTIGVALFVWVRSFRRLRQRRQNDSEGR